MRHACLDGFSAGLAEELAYRIGLWEEAALEDGEPFVWNDAQVYAALTDMETTDAGIAPWTTEVRRWYIARGVYVPKTDAELAAIMVCGGKHRKKYDFILDGQKYCFERGLKE